MDRRAFLKGAVAAFVALGMPIPLSADGDGIVSVAPPSGRCWLGSVRTYGDGTGFLWLLDKTGRTVARMPVWNGQICQTDFFWRVPIVGGQLFARFALDAPASQSALWVAEVMDDIDDEGRHREGRPGDILDQISSRRYQGRLICGTCHS